MERETPAGMGFGAAAMSLAPKFRVSEGSFSAALKAGTVLTLPVNFGAPPEYEPLNVGSMQEEPLDLPSQPPEFTSQFYPPRARAARQEGEATVVCGHRFHQLPSCVIESETPPGWGFGAAAIEMMQLEPTSLGALLVSDSVTRAKMKFELD
ncbi:MAG: hypothetical protein JNJ73_04205 [Hyphomonadaceae bacterium]|nr:hypothetical protein [Hyphomonadaceae bacterium]